MIAAKMSLQRVRGFTLIESIIAMVVMGIAMVMLFTLFSLASKILAVRNTLLGALH